MKIEETRNTIIMRSHAIEMKRRHAQNRIMEGCSILLLLVLVAVMNKVSVIKSAKIESAYYGSLRLGPEAGAYVMVGIICFIIGVLITIIAVNKKKDAEDKDKEE